MKKICSIVLVGCLLFLTYGFPLARTYADITPTPTPTPDPSTTTSTVGDCASKGLSASDCVSYYQQKVSQTSGEVNTLQAQIDTMDNQINLTEAQIYSTQQQILDLTLNIATTTSKISSLQGSIDNLTKVLLNRIVATYEVGSSQPFQVLVSSSDIHDFFVRANYLKIAQAHDKQLIYNTVQAKNDYANQQQIFETQKKQVEALKAQLVAYTDQLNQQKADKQRLLTETQGEESTYQSLLAQAQAQLAGFSNFVTAQGGATPLSNQTICDDWGCYYNQRDTQWGGIALGGSQYSIADDGCLLTSMAMIYTHYGHRGVTPLSINGNPSNFASYNRAYLLKTIVADGTSSSRVGGVIDSELSAGRPIVVGISYDGGPIADHFVVLISGSGGSYMMNDPFTPNGHNIPFTSHYSIGSIVEIDKVLI